MRRTVVIVGALAAALSFGVWRAHRAPLSSGGGSGSQFSATSLIDFTPGQLYLGAFPGLLYDGSNSPPADHDADGKSFAAQVQPINGKIVVVGIGMSNWTLELCGGSTSKCPSYSFYGMAAGSSAVNHTSLVLVNCAQSGVDASGWTSPTSSAYQNCQSVLSAAGLTESQVQVVLFKDVDKYPSGPLTSTMSCPNQAADACLYLQRLGQIARAVRSRYPSSKELFVHPRIYAGYATTLNPEPFAYEYGFATKWFVAAQINQLRGSGIDPTAGNLSYSVAPWIAWGPYFWASDNTPRSDGLVWLPQDFLNDGTHPSPSGIQKVANMMMSFYLSSAYSPWFRTQ